MCVVRVLSYFYVERERERERDKRERERERRENFFKEEKCKKRRTRR